MKTLRRPMFRRGGEVDGGITSGMRTNFREGTNREQFEEIMKKYSTPAVDPVAQLLIQGGLRGLSETGGGGTLANLARAFEPAVGQAFRSMEGQRGAQRNIELEGLKFDIAEKERQEKIAREKLFREEDKDFEKEILGLKQTGQERIQLLKNASGGDKTAVQKLADQAISLGQFENTPEGRKQAFEYFTLSSGDLLRSSMADRIADYAKTNFPGEDMVGTAKATFVLETLPELQEKGYSVDILKPYVNTKKEVKLKKLTPNKVYFDVATQQPVFFDGTGLKPIE
jgi:hypothetical protein|tara:strand:- start:1993 stop:2844 length:852 start_codon:yes stop_codon:yes gene_type:complete